MFPVLFSIGSISISSFGVFLALGFLFGVFLVWRLSRAWDLDEEKVLDLTLVTFLGGLVGARLYFGLENLPNFAPNIFRLILINKYPGFSFWGAFLGGFLTLFYFTKKFKLDFWHIADLASVGFLGGLILSNLGCFFGGCGIGIPSKLFFSVFMVGNLGKRFPVQALEALLLTIVLIKIWAKAKHFHLRGKIASLSLIFIGVIKLLMEPLKQIHSLGYFFEGLILILGFVIFYKIQWGKRTPVSDLKSIFKTLMLILQDGNFRKSIVDQILKSWYNQKTSIVWQMKGFGKILRKIHVKPTPKNTG